MDLYLVHWPYPEKNQATWEAMEVAHQQGLVKSLGLSNFRPEDIDALMQHAEVKPVYNQLELHPYLNQKPLVEFCQARDILVACWSPLGTGSWSGVPTSEKPITNPTIAQIANEYGVGVGQVILKWNLQRGRCVIPKAESIRNIQANLALFDFTLAPEHLDTIDGLNIDKRFGGDPDTALAHSLTMTVPQ